MPQPSLTREQAEEAIARVEAMLRLTQKALTILDECVWTDHSTGDFRIEHDGSVERAREIMKTLEGM